MVSPITMFYVRNIIGKRVKEARLNFTPKMTQANLATKLQLDDWIITRVSIAKIESGIRQVRDYELVKLARALNVNVDWLLEGEK